MLQSYILLKMDKSMINTHLNSNLLKTQRVRRQEAQCKRVDTTKYLITWAWVYHYHYITIHTAFNLKSSQKQSKICCRSENNCENLLIQTQTQAKKQSGFWLKTLLLGISGTNLISPKNSTRRKAQSLQFWQGQRRSSSKCLLLTPKIC